MVRKAHEPTEKTKAEVTALASVGTPQDAIAKYIGIDKKTLIKHYRDVLDKAMISANAQIAQTLFKKAKGGNVPAMIFWLKARGGWQDRQQFEIIGNEEKPVATRHYKVTDAQVAAAVEKAQEEY